MWHGSQVQWLHGEVQAKFGHGNQLNLGGRKDGVVGTPTFPGGHSWDS